MSSRILLRLVLSFVAMIAAAFHAPDPVAAQRGGPDDITVVRRAVVEADEAIILELQEAEPGSEVTLPWFDGEGLPTIIEQVNASGKFLNIVGRVDDFGIGDVVLTVGKETLVGSVQLDDETYRIRKLRSDEYELVEFDVEFLLPDQPDADEIDRAPARWRNTRSAAKSAEANPGNGLSKLRNGPPIVAGIRAEHALEKAKKDARKGPAEVLPSKPGFLTDHASNIDILVAYTAEAADWADDQGYDLDDQIENIVAYANWVFEASGIQARLDVVRTAEVVYSVVDSDVLAGDLMNLQTASTPALQQLHTLRDQHGADLVSLLVWNGGGAGETTCGVDSGRACGRAVTTRRLAQPGDIPHSVIWNYEYRFNGFSVAHMPSAFRAFTFVHEVSHNLGAHHDAYSFNQDGYDPTADPFARGWVLFEANARTVMAYRRICEDLNLFPGTPRSGICRTIPRFSSADQTYYSHPLGAATQGSAFQPIFGPADNVLAINRMAWTAANFRRSLP